MLTSYTVDGINGNITVEVSSPAVRTDYKSSHLGLLI